MKLKTTNSIVLEQGIQHKNNSIELVGCKNLCNCDVVLENLVKENKICDKKNTFVKNFGFNSKFYYKISHRKNFEYSSGEIGLGCLEKIDNKIFLKRIQTFIAIDNGKIYSTHGSCQTFDCTCDDDGILIVSTYNPIEYLAILIDPHCIISSIGEGIASPVYVDKNSVVGRLGENVESISIKSLLNEIIKYEDGKVKFFNGDKWINLVEENNEDTK